MSAVVFNQCDGQKSRPLKVFTDPKLIPPGGNIHWLIRPLLDPDLRNSDEDRQVNLKGRKFHKIVAPFNRIAHTLFQLTDLENCDVAMVPMDWTDVRGGYSWHGSPNKELLRKIKEFARAAVQAKKPVVVFFCEERSHEPVDLPGAYVFRCSIYRSRMTDRDIAVPQIILHDLQREFPARDFAPRPKTFPPTIGFCGFTRPVTLAERLKTVGFKLYTRVRLGYADVSQYKGIELRDKCIKSLQNSARVKPNFLLRSSALDVAKDKDVKLANAQARQEFVDTILGSDYQLCLRGSANYSIRFWETLCAGRIPLFIDTDCVLPFEQHIDWSDYLVIHDERDIKHLPEFLADFHSSCPDEEFLSRQRRCREIWENIATPQSFASLTANYLQEIVNGN